MPGQGLEAIIAFVAGYFTPLLVSLSVRQKWSSMLRFATAFGMAAAVAAIVTAIGNHGFSRLVFEANFGIAFGVQQAAWHLQLPIAGDPGINNNLAVVGEPEEPLVDPSKDVIMPKPSNPDAPMD